MHRTKSSGLIFAIAFFLVLGLVNVQASPNSEINSGIEGVISKSPSQPGPTRQDVPDSAPFPDAPLVVKREGKMIMTLKTDSQGRFRIPLPPGAYEISVKGQKPGIGSCGPFEVKVVAGETQHVRWECDTGMR